MDLVSVWSRLMCTDVVRCSCGNEAVLKHRGEDICFDCGLVLRMEEGPIFIGTFGDEDKMLSASSFLIAFQ